jgi:hypothetical protein
MLETSKIVFEKERDFSEKVSATLNFVTKNIKVFVSSILYLTAPLMLIAGILNGLIQKNVFSVLGETKPIRNTGKSSAEIIGNVFGQQASRIFTLNYGLMICFIFLATIMTVITVYAFIIQYRTDNTDLSIQKIWQRVKALFVPLVTSFMMFTGMVASIILGLVFMIGSMVKNANSVELGVLLVMILTIPIIYLTITYLLSTAVLAFEEISIVESFKRAHFLIKNKWWSTLGLLLMIMLINYFISIIFSLPLMIISLMKAFSIDNKLPNDIALIASSTLSTTGNLLLGSFNYIAISFQYFNLVEKKESRGLLLQIEQIGKKNIEDNQDADY